MTSRRGQDGGSALRMGAERWEAWPEHLQGQQTRHWISEQVWQSVKRYFLS